MQFQNQYDHIQRNRAVLTIWQGPAVISNIRGKRFIPYESPLKQFKSFRYHPDYLAEVPHGFRSMTYIHNIDPERPICRYELDGGVCNDDSCDGQHFRNMSLSGASSGAR